MATISTSRMTTDEFLRDFVNEKGIEFVNGEIERAPMPGNRHGKICSKANFLISRFVIENRRGHVISHDSFLRLANGNVRGPDITFVSFDRLPSDQDVPEGAMDVPVEIVIEVRSPSQTYLELLQKAEEYVENGVQVAVVIDPETHSAGVFRATELPQRFHNGDLFELPDVLPGFRVPVSEFFA